MVWCINSDDLVISSISAGCKAMHYEITCCLFMHLLINVQIILWLRLTKFYFINLGCSKKPCSTTPIMKTLSSSWGSFLKCKTYYSVKGELCLCSSSSQVWTEFCVKLVVTPHTAIECPAPQPMTAGLRSETSRGWKTSACEPSPHIPCSFQPHDRRHPPENRERAAFGQWQEDTEGKG